MTARVRPMRCARAAVFALGGTALGVGAHRLAGGMQPPLWFSGLALVALFAVALASGGRERGRPAVMALVVGTQTVLHLGLSVVGMAAMTGMTGSDRSLAEMVLCMRAGHHPVASDLASARRSLRELGISVPDAHAAAGVGATTMHMGAAMIGAHLLAALVLGWWLARGERLVWRCAQRVVETIRSAAAGLPTLSFSRSLAVIASVQPASARWWRLAAAGRAPPRGTRAFSAHAVAA